MGKSLPLGLAALYICGFTIVARHLAGYGASSLDLFKVQYLAAGFWFGGALSLFIGVNSAVSFAMGEYIAQEFGRRTDFWQSREGRNLVGAIVSNCIAALGIGVPTYILRGRPTATAILGFLPTLVAVDLMLRTWLYLQSRATPSNNIMPRYRAQLFTVMFALSMCLCTVNFARKIYPTIPFSMGGGQPRQVRFWLDAASKADSFLERDGSNPFTVQYELLLETESSFVVISPKAGQKAIEFDRKAVSAVIVLGKRTGPAYFERSVTN